MDGYLIMHSLIKATVHTYVLTKNEAECKVKGKIHIFLEPEPCFLISSDIVDFSSPFRAQHMLFLTQAQITSSHIE